MSAVLCAAAVAAIQGELDHSHRHLLAGSVNYHAAQLQCEGKRAANEEMPRQSMFQDRPCESVCLPHAWSGTATDCHSLATP